MIDNCQKGLFTKIQKITKRDPTNLKEKESVSFKENRLEIESRLFKHFYEKIVFSEYGLVLLVKIIRRIFMSRCFFPAY